MKRLFYIVVLIAIAACSNNGLNKPITEELTADELRANFKKNPSFEYEYETYSSLRNWINADNTRKAKYGDFSYKDIDRYWKCGPTPEQINKEHLELFPNRESLRHQADSILQYYRSVQPDSLIALTFVKKTVRHSWLDDTPEFHIKVTPLKGPIEQFNFYYYFSEKINGIRDIDDIPFSLVRRGYQRTPITKESVHTYMGELWTDVLTNTASDDLIRDYNFLYKITNIRYNGINWEDLPLVVQGVADKDFKSDEMKQDRVIYELITKDYIPCIDYSVQRHDEEARKEYPTIFKMYKEFYGD